MPDPERRLRILLVDDEPDILTLLQAMLAASSWEVIGKARSGADALRLAATLEPDVAVVDYMMPGMNGVEMAERLKALWPECEVVLFSAFDLAAEALDSPWVDRFLDKTQVAKLDDVLQEVAESRGLG